MTLLKSIHSLFFVLILVYADSVFAFGDEPEQITFWNGNKTEARQTYEADLLKASLAASEGEFGRWQLNIDNTNYPKADDEGAVFENGADILVTVAGNVKFADKAKIIIHKPITKGLLGYRLLLVRNAELNKFNELKRSAELRALTIGIPATWADAELFRENKFKVVEKGNFDELFHRLKKGEFDYAALGANEIEAAFNQRVKPVGGISIASGPMIYYPFPLLFYVDGAKPELAKRVEKGLNTLIENGDFEEIFLKHHGDIVNRLNLKQRTIFSLKNPVLPENMADFKATLLD